MGFFRFSLPGKAWAALIMFGAFGGFMIVAAEMLKKHNETLGLIVLFFVAMYILIMSVLAGLNLAGNPDVRWHSKT